MSSRYPSQLLPFYLEGFKDKDWIVHEMPKQDDMDLPSHYRPDTEVEIHPHMSHLIPLHYACQYVEVTDCLKRMWTVHSQLEPNRM
uniref:Uncharacterized protein n=1 Tax=Steinernema glaseri TaxID=37863 RepID=A0A1I7ZBZ3_9BILA